MKEKEVSGALLREEIARLKKEKNALIMAHYYQRDEIQEIDRKRTRLNSSH